VDPELAGQVAHRRSRLDGQGGGRRHRAVQLGLGRRGGRRLGGGGRGRRGAAGPGGDRLAGGGGAEEDVADLDALAGLGGPGGHRADKGGGEFHGRLVG